ncbi:acyltransferase family protein [Microvirga antarctica]|uniref:acyltransferase family protein n=1 Tax=Microvirga antarctica TaxID=2819233 RepID=UPI001B30B1C9|nr:acyltransferase [Microvirga antarctica]
MSKSPAGRVSYLDGLRGVAILMVLLFHAFARWPELVPFGDAFKDVALFRVGYIGVNLFFIISGFVILMTLEKCASFRIFITRRWMRLFPAMLICSAIIFITAPLFPERPLGLPVLRDLLPGLSFVEPMIWERVLGGHQGVLEGAFWSLYVEMKFYVVFGLLYFALGRSAAIAAIAGLFVLTLLLAFIGTLMPSALGLVGPAGKVLLLLGSEYYGWFAAGALFYLYTVEKRSFWLWTGMAIALIAAAAMAGPSAKIAAVLVTMLFAAPLVSRAAQTILSQRALLFLGFVSYPLYLLHENLMIAGMVKLGRVVPALPPLLYPVLPIAALLVLAWVVAVFLEPRVKMALQAGFRRVRGRAVAAT